MDAAPPDISWDLTPSSSHEDIRNVTEMEHSDDSASCALCRRILSSEHELSNDLYPFSVCGDCRFLLEDFSTPTPESQQRRPDRGRRSRYSSTESLEDMFSHQFLQILNRARQSQSVAHDHEDSPVEFDASLRLIQHTSSLTTPSSSRRSHRLMSDSESDIFDYSESYFGGSESNLSFTRRRLFHGDFDTFSFSANGGDSDNYADGNSEYDMYIPPLEISDVDSDTDIDPMHVGAVHWNSDDHEELYNNEQEEASDGNNMAEHRETLDRLRPGDVGSNHWPQRGESSEFEVTDWRHQEAMDMQQIFPNIFAEFDELGGSQYLTTLGDYFDARGFEQSLLANSERQGAPPAAVSTLATLPRVVIGEEHLKPDGLACAICKDLLTVGTETNQLPCSHLYHPSCIFPWLTTRNSCPLCRYELPTDDMDYEERKNNASSRLAMHGIRQQGAGDDNSSSSSEITDATELDEAQEARELGGRDSPTSLQHRDNDRGRWFLLAAAPIISIMGVAFMLWLGNQQADGVRALVGHQHINPRGTQPGINIGSCQPNQQRNRRRWWWWF